MGRALLVATLLVTSSPVASAQALSTLHITVTLADATGKITPVARHALLISEEPPTTGAATHPHHAGRHGRRLAASRALCRGVRSAGARSKARATNGRSALTSSGRDTTLAADCRQCID